MANKKRELVAGSRHAAFILLCQEKKGEGSIELKHGALTRVAKFFKTMETTMCHYPHTGKEKLARRQQLHITLELISHARQYLGN